MKMKEGLLFAMFYKICLSLILMIFSFHEVFAFQSEQTSPPNIILFMVDDMGWVDTSLPFLDSMQAYNKVYHTPNMERMANEGMKFSNAYATPVCTPTRVSWLTGMNTSRHGVTNWTHILRDHDSDNAFVDADVTHTDWNLNGYSPIEGIPNTVTATSVVDLLKQHGYRTIHIGKAHWGPFGTPGSEPTNLGFQVNIGGHAGGRPASYLGELSFGDSPNSKDLHRVPHLQRYHGKDIFLTDALTQEAIAQMDYAVERKAPFFLHLSHYAIHDPYEEDKRFIKEYIDKGMTQTEAMYAALIEGMDKSLGDVLNYLKQKEIDDQTVIIFMSDNGGLSLGYARDGEPHTHNSPLRSGKGSVYEGGIRVPMIVRWPGNVMENSRSDYPIIIEDFFPSLLDLAGIENVNIMQEIDGQSFVPYTLGKGQLENNRSLIWHLPHKWTGNDGPGINYKSAMRKGKWKLVLDLKTSEYELFDLESDISEAMDLKEHYPQKAKELADELIQTLKSRNAPMPNMVRKN